MKIIIILTLTLLSTLETTSILNKYNAKIRKMSRNKENEFNQYRLLNNLILKLSKYTYHQNMTESDKKTYVEKLAKSIYYLRLNFDKLDNITSYKNQILFNQKILDYIHLPSRENASSLLHEILVYVQVKDDKRNDTDKLFAELTLALEDYSYKQNIENLYQKNIAPSFFNLSANFDKMEEINSYAHKDEFRKQIETYQNHPNRENASSLLHEVLLYSQLKKQKEYKEKLASVKE